MWYDTGYFGLQNHKNICVDPSPPSVSLIRLKAGKKSPSFGGFNITSRNLHHQLADINNKSVMATLVDTLSAARLYDLVETDQQSKPVMSGEAEKWCIIDE